MQDTPWRVSFSPKIKYMIGKQRIKEGQYPFQTGCLFYEGYITPFDTTKDAIGIRIYNPALFEMQKQMFEMCWDSLG